MRLELTNTGFAIRRLSRLATRAEWNGRRDSNSRIEFGRLACFRLHHFRERRELRQLAPWLWGEIIDQKWNSWQDLNPQPRRSKRRALPFELQERKELEHRTGFEPVSQHWQRRVLNQTGPTMRAWSGRTELNCHHEFPGLGCCVTPHPEMIYGLR